MALIIALVTVNLLKPGVGMNVDLSKIDTSTVDHYIVQTHNTDITSFLLNIIPNSFVSAFVEGQVLQVLYIAVLCGFALAWMGQRAQPIIDLIDTASQMFFGIVKIVMWAAPLGAFGAIAFTVGRFGLGSLQSLGWLLGSFYLTCLIFIFGALGPIAYFCGFSLLKLLRYIWEEILIVLATTSSEVVLPRLIKKMEAAGCEKSVVGLVVANRLFLQSRRHLSLSRHDDRVPGAGDEYVPRSFAADRIAADPASYLQRRGRRCRRGLCRVGGDAGLVQHHSCHERRAGPGHSSFHVRRAHPDESHWQCGRHNCRGEMGKRSRHEATGERAVRSRIARRHLSRAATFWHQNGRAFPVSFGAL